MHDRLAKFCGPALAQAYARGSRQREVEEEKRSDGNDVDGEGAHGWMHKLISTAGYYVSKCTVAATPAPIKTTPNVAGAVDSC